MPDIRLEWWAGDIRADLVLDPATGLYDTGHDLVTALVVSLFSDRLADPDDVLPDDGADRRGWWGDTEAVAIWGAGASRIGSRLWLLSREKRVPSTLVRAVTYVREAIAWMTDPAVRAVATFDVSCLWFNPATGAEAIDIARLSGSEGALSCRIVAHRHDGARVAARFDRLWRDFL